MLIAGMLKDEAQIAAVHAAANQAAAIRLARQEDLPALATVDTVLIEEFLSDRAGRRVLLRKRESIQALRHTLKARVAPPSAGVNAATLTFYRGTTLIRKIWVFKNGEWGFYRPWSLRYTTGQEPALFQVIQQYLK